MFKSEKAFDISGILLLVAMNARNVIDHTVGTRPMEAILSMLQR